MNEPWFPPINRADGYECLAWHRGKWTHVKWSAEHKRWHLGYAGPYIMTLGRMFAPLPTPPAEGTFYDDKEGRW